MSYHYSANHGWVFPFDEKTAEELGCLDEFKLLEEHECLDILTDEGSNCLDNVEDNDIVNQIFAAQTKIEQAIDALIPEKTWEIYRETSDVLQNGKYVADDTYVVFVYQGALFDMTPQPLFQELKDKFGLIEDYWVTGG